MDRKHFQALTLIIFLVLPVLACQALTYSLTPPTPTLAASEVFNREIENRNQ